MAMTVTAAVTGNNDRTRGDLELLFRGEVPGAYASVSVLGPGLSIQFTDEEPVNPRGIGQTRVFNRLTEKDGVLRLHVGIRGRLPGLAGRTVPRHPVQFTRVTRNMIFILTSEVTKR